MKIKKQEDNHKKAHRGVLQTFFPKVGRNDDGTFKMGNKLQKHKPIGVEEFLASVNFVEQEMEVPLLVQALRMAYVDAKLMGKVLDKFVSNAGDSELKTKEAIQIIIQNYLGAKTDEKIIEVDIVK